MIRRSFVALVFSIGITMGGSLVAAESEAPADTDTRTTPVAAPKGLLPAPDYSGDFWSRNRLTGDWGGTRTDLANKGIQFDTIFTQTMQSVVDGGRDTGTRYGGSLDYLLTLDLMRMGVLPGAMVKFRAETRYGEAANDIAGPVLPVNTDGFFPLGDSLDDNIGIALTNLTYYQFLSEQFGVALGKIDTLDTNPNEFASGRGTSQFMNASLVIPASPLVAAPAYSTLGAGVLWLPIKGVTISSLVINASDSSTTSGFEDFGEGTAWITEVDLQYHLGKLPGGQNIGVVYGFDNNFIDLNDRFVFERGRGLVPPTTDETWAVYWGLWQYLFVEKQGEALINTTNGKQDLQGVGLFLRIGFADDDTSPVDYAISGGLGAMGLIPGRDNDTCGLGYYFYSIETSRFTERVGLEDDSQGFEAYYNVAITPATDLTFDIQVVESPQSSIDSATILGLRLNLRF